MTDPVERADELDREILAIPADQVFTKHVVTRLGTVVVGLLLVLVAMVFLYSRSTNHAVTQTIPQQRETILDLRAQIAQQEDIEQQQTNAIVRLIAILRVHGIPPPNIVIRPHEKTSG